MVSQSIPRLLHHAPLQVLNTRYTEASTLLKSPQDTIWHAAVLEGLATLQVVDAWSATQAGVCTLSVASLRHCADRFHVGPLECSSR